METVNETLVGDAVPYFYYEGNYYTHKIGIGTRSVVYVIPDSFVRIGEIRNVGGFTGNDFEGNIQGILYASNHTSEIVYLQPMPSEEELSEFWIFRIDEQMGK